VLRDDPAAAGAALFFLLHPYTIGLSVFMFPRAGQPVGDFHKDGDHRVRTPQTASVWPLLPHWGRGGRLRGLGAHDGGPADRRRHGNGHGKRGWLTVRKAWCAQQDSNLRPSDS
jgi:hypothetical protein